jgi:hypothetical protein|nr:MAG TPA: hypothetical protein [Caudoviricetes sp.]
MTTLVFPNNPFNAKDMLDASDPIIATIDKEFPNWSEIDEFYPFIKGHMKLVGKLIYYTKLMNKIDLIVHREDLNWESVSTLSINFATIPAFDEQEFGFDDEIEDVFKIYFKDHRLLRFSYYYFNPNDPRGLVDAKFIINEDGKIVINTPRDLLDTGENIKLYFLIADILKIHATYLMEASYGNVIHISTEEAIDHYSNTCDRMLNNLLTRIKEDTSLSEAEHEAYDKTIHVIKWIMNDFALDAGEFKTVRRVYVDDKLVYTLYHGNAVVEITDYEGDDKPITTVSAPGVSMVFNHNHGKDSYINIDGVTEGVTYVLPYRDSDIAYLSYPTALTSIIRDTLFAYTTGIPQASRLK